MVKLTQLKGRNTESKRQDGPVRKVTFSSINISEDCSFAIHKFTQTRGKSADPRDTKWEFMKAL